MRRSIRRFFAAIGHWGFTIMIVPRRGGIRRLSVPWLGVIGLSVAIGTIGYFIGYYPYSLQRNYNQRSTIRRQYALIHRLKKENNRVKPALDRDRRLQDQMNSYNNLIAELKAAYKSAQRKSPTHLSSRGGFRRPTPYKLPDPVISQADGEVSLLATLESNTASLTAETNRQISEASALRTQLLAYVRLLDHTPNHWPVSGRLTSWFGYRRDPVTRFSKMHTGIDLSAKMRSVVRAAADGVVSFAGWRGGYGRAIVINHGYGYQTLYGHNDTLLVTAGQTVKKGQAIARSGSSGRSTGPHLHFEIWLYGKKINPLTVLR